MSTLFPTSVDPALVMDSDWDFDEADRRKIDEQIRAIQATALLTSLSGVSATYFMLSSGSAAVVAGDTVCAAALSGFPTYVTKAVAAALAAAGAPLGIVLAPASPGSPVLVALSGLIPASVTELAASAGQVTVNTTTARAQLATGTYPLGNADSQGTLTLGLGGAPLRGGIADTANSILRFQDTETSLPISNLVSGGAAVTLATTGFTQITKAVGLYGFSKRAYRAYDGGSGIGGAQTVAVPAAWTLQCWHRPFPVSSTFAALGTRFIMGKAFAASPGAYATTPADWSIAVYFTAATGGTWTVAHRRSGQATYEKIEMIAASGKEQDAIAENIWQLLTLTYDGTTLTSYRDGLLTGTVASAGATDTSTNGKWYFGSPSGAIVAGKSGSAGLFFDMRLYNSVLTADEVLDHHAAGKPWG